MRTAFARTNTVNINPIDMVEEIVLSEDWDVERRGDYEVAVTRSEAQGNLDMFFTWSREFNCLQISCLLDIYVRKEQQSMAFEALAKVNEQLWTGHFSFWSDDEFIVYRNSLLLNKDGSVDEDMLSEMISTAVQESERISPFFKFIFENKMPLEQALEFTLLPALGEA